MHSNSFLIITTCAVWIFTCAGLQNPAASEANRNIAAASQPQSKPASRPGEDVFHDRVQIILKNGQKLGGVVKNRRFAERADGFNFSAADKADAGAGVRIWFSRPGQNYLFLPYKDIDSLKTVGRVSDLEVRELEQKLLEEAKAKRETEADERLAELQQKEKARESEREGEEKAAADAKKKEDEKAKKAAVEKAQHLLDRFPPDQGWNEDKKKAILAKKANHLYPTDEENAFVKTYDDWVKAVAIVKAVDAGEEPPLPAPEEEGAQPDPAGKQNSKKTKGKPN